MEGELNRRRFLAGGVSLPLLGAAKGPDGVYFAGARQFLDTMITKGTDRFGRKQTPVFCLALNPETHAPPKAPDKVDWEYRRDFEHLYRDFGYYWKSHLHSSNLIYDQGTIRALHAATAAAQYAYRRSRR